VVKTNAVRVLDRLGIKYELREYEVYQRRAAWPEQAGCLDGCLPMPLLLDLRDQTFANQTGPFTTRTPCTWMHSTTGRGRDCQSLDSDVLARIDTDGVVPSHRRVLLFELVLCPFQKFASAIDR
jgi:hypothetical protein